jgi:uncharacterized membrane protein
MEHGHDNDFSWQEGARHAHEGWWGGPLSFVALLLFMALLVAGVIWLVRRLAPAHALGAAPAAVAPDSAVTTLRMRYARGEVSRDDFQHTLADLTGSDATTARPGEALGDDVTPVA